MTAIHEVRKRKKPVAKSNNAVANKNIGDESTKTSVAVGTFYWVVYFPIGLMLAYYSYSFMKDYMTMLHENHLWFSNIKEVEREISLRTECGLYYSYYKRVLNAPSLWQGIVNITTDSVTEHGHEINILQRFNVYQEVALAVIYKYMNIGASGLQPILFYVYSCFHLTGMHVLMIFLLAWYLSGVISAGVLTSVYFVCGLDDSTRVFFSVNLREIFAFPFLWLQILLVCIYLSRTRRSAVADLVLQISIAVSCFLFSLMWQFNQFVLLIQVGALYACVVLQLANANKVQRVLLLDACGLLGVWLLQYFQPMILGSMVLSLIPVCVIMIHLCRTWKMSGGIVFGFSKIVFQVVLTFLLTLILNVVIKCFINLDADTHIFKFLKGKFGFADPCDFEARIYLCHGAFQFLDTDFFMRNTKLVLFPIYVVVIATVIGFIGKNMILEWCSALIPASKQVRQHVPQDVDDVSDKAHWINQRPEVAFLLLQSCLIGLVAMMTLRMKYLWFPHMIILASFGLTDVIVWQFITRLLRVPSQSLVRILRELVPLALAAYLIYFTFLPTYKTQSENLQEFYDPDTVELMEWINSNTSPDASFGGSMQLLAGVTLCTGRHVTNHPHFEDKWLRDRTKLVYQIYARRRPEQVHAILKDIDAHYIIVEDSICLAKSDGCRTPDNVDLDNGHIPDNGMKPTPYLVHSNTPRFCVHVITNDPKYDKYFKLMFHNKTFRIFKVL